MCVYVCLSMCVCMAAYVCVYKYVCMHICICVCMAEYVSVCMYGYLAAGKRARWSVAGGARAAGARARRPHTASPVSRSGIYSQTSTG